MASSSEESQIAVNPCVDIVDIGRSISPNMC
jgi:hypothetical protein